MSGSRASRFLVLALIVIACSCTARNGYSQEAFAKSSFFIHAGDRLNAPNLLEGWELSQFVGGGFATSFSHGELHAGAQHLFGRARPGIDTDARLLFLHVGWGPTLRLPLGIRISTGLDVGQVFMRFPQETISFRKSEGEVAYGVRARLGIPLTGGLEADVGVRWFHIFTSDPIDVTIASAGLRYTFDSPGWLRGLLE